LVKARLLPPPSTAPLVPHFLFDRLTLGSIEAATTISGTELHTKQPVLTIQLTMRQAAQLARLFRACSRRTCTPTAR
jgi:hypothetical protein